MCTDFCSCEDAHLQWEQKNTAQALFNTHHYDIITPKQHNNMWWECHQTQSAPAPPPSASRSQRLLGWLPDHQLPSTVEPVDGSSQSVFRPSRPWWSLSTSALLLPVTTFQISKAPLDRFKKLGFYWWAIKNARFNGKHTLNSRLG